MARAGFVETTRNFLDTNFLLLIDLPWMERIHYHIIVRLIEALFDKNKYLFNRTQKARFV